MSFNSSVLSEKTVKSFVDRLVRRYKNHPNAIFHGIKRAAIQEDVAVMLGFASWHVLISQLKHPAGSSPVPAVEGIVLNERMLKMVCPKADKDVISAQDNVSFIKISDLRRHLFLWGLEHLRQEWYQELLATHPNTPLLLVQGPLSARMMWKGAQLHDTEVVTQAFLLCSTASEIVHFLGGLLPKDNDLWKSRAMSMISALVPALVHLRDHAQIPFTGETLRQHMDLNQVVQLSKNPTLPPEVVQPLKAYLRSLPGYQEGATRQAETVNENHSYLTMQFTHPLSLLTGNAVWGVTNKHLKLSSSSAFDISGSVGVIVQEWSKRHPNSLVVFDGLEHSSPLYRTLTHLFSSLRDNNASVIIGNTSLADLPDDVQARQRLETRIGGAVHLEE